MKPRTGLLLLLSSLLLVSCASVLGWFGYSPQDMEATQSAVKRGAEAGADIMETVLEIAKLALIYFGGMLTVPGTKMTAKATMAGARKVKKMMGEKPKPQRK